MVFNGETLLNAAVNNWFLLLIIAILFISFLIWFCWPVWKLHNGLKQTITVLKKLKHGTASLLDLEALTEAMTASVKLTHCWTEFKDTLHPQTQSDEYGQERPISWRATVPAEMFFNAETLVAVELKTEYFKHQPGILTGVGIIGTFVGLLRGLANFSVSSDPEKVRVSLDTLIHGVQEAFLMSACAIGLAMLTTLIEKLVVTARIKQVEELCQLLDSLFQSGAGEEYLARLVKAGENNATQTAQLKDALVRDLKEMLAEIIQQQAKDIADSFRASSNESSGQIAKAISDSLTEPMQKIAAAVNTTTDSNGEVVTRALNDVLVTFSAKMEDMFGGQMGNMNQLLQQTTAAMQTTVTRFDALADNLSNAGTNAADAMAERMSKVLEALEARQHTLNDTMSEFVGELNGLIKNSQQETDQQLQTTLMMLGEKITALSNQLEYQVQTASENHQRQQVAFADQSQQAITTLTEKMTGALATIDDNLSKASDDLAERSKQTAQAHLKIEQHLLSQAKQLIEGMTQQIDTLANESKQAVSVMQTCVSTLRDTSDSSGKRLESSSQILSLAADNFAKAGNSVSGVTQQADAATGKLATITNALNAAANTVQTALTDYQKAGQTLGQMVEALKTTVETAKKEASVSQGLVNQIQQSAEQLQQAQTAVDGIFQAVCDELANAHREFANNVVQGLKASNTAYQQELKTAVDYLKSAIQDLGDLVDELPKS